MISRIANFILPVGLMLLAMLMLLASTAADVQWHAMRSVVGVLGIFGMLLSGEMIVRFRTRQLRLDYMQSQAALRSERQRISDDIHDELGSRLAKLAMHSELAMAGGDRAAGHLRTVGETVRAAHRSLDELVWSIKPGNDSIADLANYLANHTSEFLEDSGLSLRLDIPAAMPDRPLANDVRHELLLASKEALTNIVKHARASEVIVKFRAENRTIMVYISDNGIGIPANKLAAKGNRNGLRTMSTRLEHLGGQCRIMPREGGGTTVELSIPQ